MAKGMSLHIGLNSVDPTQYGGWSGDLNACEFDAHDMTAIAASCGFATTTVLTANATSGALLDALSAAAEELVDGDILLLTYSGHGGQVPDPGGDEYDAADETWVLFDRQVLDDELYAAYAAFQPGVRIVVFSDSCHSGTVTRLAPPMPAGASAAAAAPIGQPPLGARSRAMPPALAQRDFLNRRQLYVDQQLGQRELDRDAIQATVLLISGCQDNQLSLDGTHNGLFTATLLTVWNGGTFQGGYRRLRNRIARRMPDTQTPQLSVVGARWPEFVAQRPFTI